MSVSFGSKVLYCEVLLVLLLEIALSFVKNGWGKILFYCPGCFIAVANVCNPQGSNVIKPICLHFKRVGEVSALHWFVISLCNYRVVLLSTVVPTINVHSWYMGIGKIFMKWQYCPIDIPWLYFIKMFHYFVRLVWLSSPMFYQV